MAAPRLKRLPRRHGLTGPVIPRFARLHAAWTLAARGQSPATEVGRVPSARPLADKGEGRRIAALGKPARGLQVAAAQRLRRLPVLRQVFPELPPEIVSRLFRRDVEHRLRRPLRLPCRRLVGILAILRLRWRSPHRWLEKPDARRKLRAFGSSRQLTEDPLGPGDRLPRRGTSAILAVALLLALLLDLPDQLRNLVLVLLWRQVPERESRRNEQGSQSHPWKARSISALPSTRELHP